MKNKHITILRDRGQLTIPNSVRKSHPWLQKDQPISLTTDSPDSITLKPYSTEKKLDLEKLQKIQQIFANKQNTIDSVEFIRRDREHGHTTWINDHS